MTNPAARPLAFPLTSPSASKQRTWIKRGNGGAKARRFGKILPCNALPSPLPVFASGYDAAPKHLQGVAPAPLS